MRRVVTKVEWHPGELYARVRFVDTRLFRSAARVAAFRDQRSMANSASGKERAPYGGRGRHAGHPATKPSRASFMP